MANRFEFERRIFLALIEGRAAAGGGSATEAERERLAYESFEWAQSFIKVMSDIAATSTPFDGFAVDAEPPNSP